MTEDRDDSDAWVEAIGRYITGFAHVELLVYELYDLLPADRLSKHGRDHRDYSDRVRLMQALLRSVSWSQRKVLDQLLDKTLKFSTLRNQIAHNPMFIDVRLDYGQEHVKINPVITHAKKGHNLQHITLEVLNAKLAQLHSVSTDIAKVVSDIRDGVA